MRFAYRVSFLPFRHTVNSGLGHGTWTWTQDSNAIGTGASARIQDVTSTNTYRRDEAMYEAERCI
jgi:hypothetical protein